MAFLDYGAVVKKNGKIITDPLGGLFQNYSQFKYESNDDGAVNTDSIVTFKYTSSLKYDENNQLVDVEPYDEEQQQSLCGNYMAVIGDSECAIAFYKTHCCIALNKVVDNRPVNQGINRMYYGIEGNYDTKKPLKIDCKLVRQFKVKRFSRNTDSIYLARFYYKDDVYEVLYGYGIDPNPYYLYGKGSYYYGTYNWNIRRKSAFKRKNKNLLKKIEYWYMR